jgi:hypothetical protein
MNDSWFMSTVLCDDVRKEEGNKLSYMGIYAANIVLPSFPCTLPKLCFVMSIVGSAELEPPKALTFRVLKDEELMAEITLPEEALVAAAERASSDSARESKRLTIGTVIQLFPVQFTAPCTLKARAICGATELKGGSWPIETSVS